MNCSCEGCADKAVYSFVWAWGHHGVCCERHRFIMTQQSQRLNRALTITLLEPGAPEAVTRDERVTYNARILALQEELNELRGRASTVSESHAELTRQLRTVTAQKALLEGDLQEHRERVASLTESLASGEQWAAKARSELERLTKRLQAYDLASLEPLDGASALPHTP